MRWLIIFLTVSLNAMTSVQAFAECELQQLIGYTLVGSKTIGGYLEKGKRSDDFEGCDFGRMIVFDDNTGVRCTSYSYSYSYRPTAYIFSLGRSALKMCVEGELYDVEPIR